MDHRKDMKWSGDREAVYSDGEIKGPSEVVL